MSEETTIATRFRGPAARKLQSLLDDGWEINGVSIRRIGEHNLIDRGAVTTGGMVLWWHNPQQSTGICKHCQTPMRPGIAIEQTCSGSPDFPGGEVVTMSHGGPGKLIDCMKCEKCGWSVR